MALPMWAAGGGAGASADLGIGDPSESESKSGSRNLLRIPMDMETATQYWSFYHGGVEPTLDACRKLRHDNTFHGPVEVLWGSGEVDPIRLDGPGEQDMLKDLFRTALEWRDVFGMVPMHLRKRAKRHKGRPLVVIPQFGTGRFVLEYNIQTFTSKMVYEVTLQARSASSGTKRGPNAVQVSGSVSGSSGRGRRVTRRTLDVYVWHGSMPNIVLKQFESTVQALLPKFSEISELRRNLLVADRGSAFPTVFTESRPENRSVSEQTEQELFGRVGDPGVVTPGERHHYLRDTHRAERQEAMTAARNAAARDLPVTRFDSRTGRLNRATASRWNGSVEPLPNGESLARAVTPSSRTDIGTFEERYAEQICMAMGVPYGYIRGSGGSRIRGETEQMKDLLRASVARDRQDVNSFYAAAHELIHRNNDNEFLAQALVQVNDDPDATLSPEETKRQQEIRSHIETIAQMPERVRVEFTEEPLPPTIDIKVLEAASNTGSVSVEEQANILRRQLGLPAIDADHPLLRGVNPDEAPIVSATTTQGTGVAASGAAADGSSSSAAAAAAAAAGASSSTTGDDASSASATKKRSAPPNQSKGAGADDDASTTTKKKKKEPSTKKART